VCVSAWATEAAETRTRQMDRALKGVEAMPAERSAQVLPLELPKL
jgi:cytochrome c5